MQKIRIMIIERRLIIREGIKQMLEQAMDISVKAEVQTCGMAVDLLETLNCDAILIGNNDHWPMELTDLQSIKSRYPQIHVLLLLTVGNPANSPLASFVDGYVPLDIDSARLVNTIRGIVKRSPAQLKRKKISPQAAAPLHLCLSSRELQVVGLMAQGKTITQVATQMGLSHKTISTYRHRALVKLNCENNAQLMLYATRNDLAGYQELTAEQFNSHDFSPLEPLEKAAKRYIGFT